MNPSAVEKITPHPNEPLEAAGPLLPPAIGFLLRWGRRVHQRRDSLRRDDPSAKERLHHALHLALEHMSKNHFDVLPVVHRADIHKLEGVVTLHDVPDAYGVDRSALSSGTRQSPLSDSIRLFRFLRTPLSAGSSQSFVLAPKMLRHTLNFDALRGIWPVSFSPSPPTVRLVAVHSGSRTCMQ